MQWGKTRTPEEERVPCKIIASLIKDWERKFAADHTEPPRMKSGTDNPRPYVEDKGAENEGHLRVLAFHCGINARRLRTIKNGRCETGNYRSGTRRFVDWVSFDVADKIVCAVLGPDAWHCDPVLNECYQRTLSVKPYEKNYEHEVAA